MTFFLEFLLSLSSLSFNPNIRVLFPTMSHRITAQNAVQLAIGHTFDDTDLLVEALDTTGLRANESNQRLAMLGDALLKMILLDSWYAGGTAKGLRPSISSPRIQRLIGRRAWKQLGLLHRQQCQLSHHRSRCRHRPARPSSSWSYRQSVRQDSCNDH